MIIYKFHHITQLDGIVMNLKSLRTKIPVLTVFLLREDCRRKVFHITSSTLRANTRHNQKGYIKCMGYLKKMVNN